MLLPQVPDVVALELDDLATVLTPVALRGIVTWGKEGKGREECFAGRKKECREEGNTDKENEERKDRRKTTMKEGMKKI